MAGEDWKERENCDPELGRRVRVCESSAELVGAVVRIDGRTVASRALGAVRESIVTEY
jgi:hypothetical protein